MLALPVLLAPLLTVAALAMGASRFYDNTAARLETPGGLIAAVANYGGAQIFPPLRHRYSRSTPISTVSSEPDSSSAGAEPSTARRSAEVPSLSEFISV